MPSLKMFKMSRTVGSDAKMLTRHCQVKDCEYVVCDIEPVAMLNYHTLVEYNHRKNMQIMMLPQVNVPCIKENSMSKVFLSNMITHMKWGIPALLDTRNSYL